MNTILSKEKEKSLESIICERLNIAKIIEPDVTALLEKLSKKHHFKLVSLDTKFKTTESSIRKAKQIIENKFTDEPSDNDLRNIVYSIEDYLRYTIIISDRTFTAKVNKIISELKSKSYKVIRLNNRFSRPTYKDIISWYASENKGSIDYAFELQFHTEASFNAKKINHFIYQITRQYEDILNEINENIVTLMDQALKMLYDNVKKPKNVDEIKNIKNE